MSTPFLGGLEVSADPGIVNAVSGAMGVVVGNNDKEDINVYCKISHAILQLLREFYLYR